MTQLLTKTTDQRIVMRETWEKFKLIQQASGDSPGVRLSFYEGTIDLLMPGQDHEVFGCVIGALLFNFLVQKGNFVKRLSR